MMILLIFKDLDTRNTEAGSEISRRTEVAIFADVCKPQGADGELHTSANSEEDRDGE